jgi:RimJ/RimL family protein N-acetyltransferase
MEKIDLGEGYFLSVPEVKDISAYLHYFSDPEISSYTFIPFPYTETDAWTFIGICRNKEKEFGHPLIFAIRNNAGELIGAIGFQGKNTHPAWPHKDEIGYWLAKEYRGKGIMTAAINAMVKYGEEVRGLTRFEAPVFSFNAASEKVLLKCGFKEEGVMKNAYFKNGKLVDAKMFALVK